MQVSSNYKNNVSFGSIYKYNVTTSDLSSGLKANAELEMKANNDSFQFFSDYTSMKELNETGVVEKVHIYAKDKYDRFVEAVLKKKNIIFNKYSSDDAMKPENIYNRIVMPKCYQDSDKLLVSVDTAKIEELFKKDECYISPYGAKGAISNRYQNVIEFLKTGHDIDATVGVLYENQDGLNFSVIDGRHRFSVMRDMGMKKVKIVMSQESANLAEKYGLISE